MVRNLFAIPSFPKNRAAQEAEARLSVQRDPNKRSKVLVDRMMGAFRIVRIQATKIADQWVSTSMVDRRIIFEGVWMFHSISVRNVDSAVSEPTEIFIYDGTAGGNGAISLASGLTSEYQKLHWTNGSQMLFRGTWIPRARIYCSTENNGDLFAIDIIAEKIEEGV